VAKKMSGQRYDCGNKLQFIIAQIELGLLHDEVGAGLRAYLAKMTP
jgi:UTP--glucose-1-phosphate uridylyltransferase